MNIIKRFWSKVDKGEPEECWEWLAYVSDQGYGQYCINGNPQQAHRVSWAIAHRTWPIPEGMICHKCDNRSCVNPNHLYLGNNTTNQQDASSLEPEDIKLIRWLYKSGDYTQKHIGKMFRISPGGISNICNYQAWSNII